MKPLGLTAILLTMLSPLVFFPACAQEEIPINTLTAQERQDGWKLLFDGNSTAGWRLYRGQDAGTWSVRDGLLVSGKGDLMTAAQYANFEFSLDFKFEKGNNSGIIYRCLETKGPSHSTGPEMQVMNDKPGSTLGKNSVGSLYDMFAPSSNPIKPATDWNTLKVICNGKNIQHFINGVKVIDVTIGSDQWNEAYAKSKWKNTKEFAASPRGHPALQDHGGTCLFRNIKIRVLPESK